MKEVNNGIREIVKHPAKILTQTCKEVTVIDEEIITLLDDMYETMVEYDGMGIAAPQVNVPLRIAIVELGEERTLIEMINPTVIETRRFIRGHRRLFKFPGLYGKWKDQHYVKIEAHDREGQVFINWKQRIMMLAVFYMKLTI